MKKIFLTILFCLIAVNGWGATVTWQGDESATWSTGGNWDTGSAPTSSDDVVLTGSAACTLTGSTTIRSLNASAYTGTFTHNASVTLTIGDATAGAGNKALDFSAGMTYTLGSATSSAIVFLSSSATQQTINFNGKAVGNTTIGSSSVAGNYILAGDIGSTSPSDTFQLFDIQRGTFNTGNYDIHVGRFYSNVSTTRSISLGSSAIKVYRDASNAGFMFGTNNLTFDAGTSTLSMQGNGFQFYGSSLTFYNVEFPNITTGEGRIYSTFTATNISISGGGSGNCWANFTVTGTLTLSGTSATSRLFITGSALGTTGTITNTGATVTVTNADFRDVTFSTAVDLSSITGGSGDCGGNSNITFTTADDWYWNGSGTRNLSDYTYWYTATNGGGSQMASTRTVLPQDTLYVNADSIDGATTIDQDLPRIPTIDFTGSGAMAFHMNNRAQAIYGSLTFVDNVTVSTSWDCQYAFYGRGAYGFNPANQGNKDRAIKLYAISGSLTLGGNIGTGYQGLEINNGTFDFNGYSTVNANFSMSGSSTRRVDLGEGTIVCRGWNATTTTNLTFNAETSTVELTQQQGNVTLAGGGCTYNNFTISGGITGTVITTISGNNTFNTLTISAPASIKFTDGTTTNVGYFVATGDASNGITLTGSSTAGWTISDSAGTNAVEYCTISYSTASGGATWNAFTSAGNVDGGNNSGWDFGSAVTRNRLMIIQ